MKKFWSWVKQNVWPLLATIGAVILGVLFVHGRNERLSMKAKLAVEKERAKIREQLAVRAALIESAGAKDEHIQQLDDQIVASKRRVLEIHEKPVPSTAEGVADAFASLGY